MSYNVAPLPQKMEHDSAPPQPEHGKKKGSRFYRGIGRLFFAPPRRPSEQERITLLQRGAWLGETTWFAPGTSAGADSEPIPGLVPQNLNMDELAAALQLKLINRSHVPQDLLDALSESGERSPSEIRDAAITLLGKLTAD